MTHQRKAASTQHRVLAGVTAAGARVRPRRRSSSGEIAENCRSVAALWLARSGRPELPRGRADRPPSADRLWHQVDLLHGDVESNQEVVCNPCERVIDDGVGAACTLAMVSSTKCRSSSTLLRCP